MVTSVIKTDAENKEMVAAFENLHYLDLIAAQCRLLQLTDIPPLSIFCMMPRRNVLIVSGFVDEK